MKPVFDPLERIAFLEREVDRLRVGEECHVARPGEGTYECRHDNKCAACRLRSAEWRAQNAFTRGAEEMRLACQQWCRAWENNGEAIADALADLRVEDKA